MRIATDGCVDQAGLLCPARPASSPTSCVGNGHDEMVASVPRLRNNYNEQSVKLLHPKNCWTLAPSNSTIAHMQLAVPSLADTHLQKHAPWLIPEKVSGMLATRFRTLSDLALSNCLNATANLIRPEA